MSRLTFYQGLLQNLEGKIQKGRMEYLPVEEAYEALKKDTGQDFGLDPAKWKEWLKNNKKN